MTDKSLVTQGQSLGYFQPEALEQAIRVAEKFFKAGCFSSDVKSPEQAFVKIQAGAEMGMGPMESMNGLLLINGHVTMWGSALTKRLREHGWKIEYGESSKDKAVVTISKGDETYTETAEKTDVKQDGAYKFAPKQKLRWHALAQLVRFNVPEVMGAVSYLTEEAEDIPATNVVVVNNSVSVEKIIEKINLCETEEEYALVVEEITSTANIFSLEEQKTMKAAAAARKPLLKKKDVGVENLDSNKVPQGKSESVDGEVVDEEKKESNNTKK